MNRIWKLIFWDKLYLDTYIWLSRFLTMALFEKKRREQERAEFNEMT